MRHEINAGTFYLFSSSESPKQGVIILVMKERLSSRSILVLQLIAYN